LNSPGNQLYYPVMFSRRAFFTQIGRPALAGMAAVTLRPALFPQVLEAIAHVKGTPQEIARDGTAPGL